MDDIPDDLTDIGTHQDEEAPTETGQTVRSPSGPDPRAEQASASRVLFQVVGDPSGKRLAVQAHSPRVDLPPPDEGEEIGQYRSVDALREGLSDFGIDGWTAVFQNESDRKTVASDVTSRHPWIGEFNYRKITFFEDPHAARAFATADD